MSFRRFSVFPVVFFASFVLLAGTSSVAVADHCKGKHKNDPGCGDDGGGSGIIFSVAVVGDPDALPGSQSLSTELHGTNSGQFREQPRHDGYFSAP